MAKQVKIKDIAMMAGVSVGTVDRVLHNRGRVSAESLAAVKAVLKDVGYSFNIHSSAVALKKKFRIAITTPTSSPGDYWAAIHSGFEHAMREFADIDLDITQAPYNQFDVYSCRDAYGEIRRSKPDVVVIGATFVCETVELCQSLDREGIPYIFIDAVIKGTKPIATYSADQYACGFIVGRLLHSLVQGKGDLALLEMKRTGDMSSNNSLLRIEGFKAYLQQAGLGGQLRDTKFSAVNPEENEELFKDFFLKNPEVRGIAVMNSRGYVVADYMKRAGIRDVSLVCFDLTTNNLRCIDDGSISVLLCQRPELQGFHAVKSAISWLLYRQPQSNPHHVMPIDIILKENLPFYREMYTE